MYMAYTTNPHLPRVRMQAVRLVKERRWSTRAAARHFGYSQSAVVKWIQRAQVIPSNSSTIPTRSSRPHHHPRQLSDALVAKILSCRHRYRRCAEVIHHLLGKDGVAISLSSVKRTLKRNGCSRFSKWKKWHSCPPRPIAEKPGILVQIDTVWDGAPESRLYLYTLLDVCSRWGYAWPTERINTFRSIGFIERAQRWCPFSFRTLQSDHGGEFARRFTTRLLTRGIAHRHSRVRMPSDNGHLERFNRTIQEECINRLPRRIAVWRREIPQYLEWYNTKRPHMALGMKSPLDIIQQ